MLQIEKGAGLPADGVLVCGDSGNDIELFAVPGVRGCMVVNAHPELRKYCEAHASENIFQVLCSAGGPSLNSSRRDVCTPLYVCSQGLHAYSRVVESFNQPDQALA